MRNKTGKEKLAGTIQKRMGQVANYGKTPTVELGNIMGDMSLKVDSNPANPFPPFDYMVCRHYWLDESESPPFTKTKKAGLHQHPIASNHQHPEAGLHEHIGLFPKGLRPIEPGDRVLVVWAGSEPIVVDIVLPADGPKFKGE